MPPSDGLSADEERYLIDAARKVGVTFSNQKTDHAIDHHKPKLVERDQKLYRPSLPKVSCALFSIVRVLYLGLSSFCERRRR